MKMKRIALWLPKQGKGRGINILKNPKLKERSRICPKWSVFTVTSMEILPLTVHRRRRISRLLDLQLERL